MAEIVDFGLQQHKIKMDSRYFENVLSVVVGDTGRRLEVQLLDTNGMVQDTTGLNLRLNAEIAGKATFTDATLVDATTGKYQLDLSNGMFLAPGDWEFQWQITDSSGKKLNSFAFAGNVGKNITEGGVEATNFYLNIDSLKAMQDDLVNGTFNSEALETNIAGKLEALEETYAPRLTEVTAQLEQTKYHHKIDKILAKMQRKEPVIIVCFGDSMTWGYVSSGVQVAEPYPAVLQRKLRYLYDYDGITVYNEGMSGTTSNGGNANYDARVSVHNPDLVLLMYGLNDNNDILDIATYQNNLRSMIEKGWEKGAETVLLSPTPTNLADSQYNLENINYAKAVMSVAEENETDFVDLNAHFSHLFKQNAIDQRTYEGASVHFKQDGYTLIADIIIKELMYPYVRADYKDGEFLSFQSPFVKNNVTTSLIRATSKLQKYFYVKSTTPDQRIGFAIYNDTPDAVFKLYTTRDITGGTISVSNFGVTGETLSNYGELLIDYEVSISLPIGFNYFELLGEKTELDKQFITSGGYLVKPKPIKNFVQPIMLKNSWVNFSSTYESARVVKTEDNIVFLEGMIKSGVSIPGSVIGTLPDGFRPLKTHSFSVGSSDGTNFVLNRLEIDNLGDITIRGIAHNSFLVLDGISFLVGS